MHRSWVVVVLALCTALAACGGSANVSATPGTAAGKSAVDPKGVLKYGQDLTASFSDNFDPGVIANGCAEIPLGLIFQSVLKNDDNVNVKPGVAQSWTLDNPLQITFKLAPNMKFSDGEALDSNAVKLSVEHTAKSPYRTSLSVISSMDTPDATTLVMHLSKPQAGDVLWSLSFLDGMVYAPSSIPDAEKTPVGSGPYTRSKYQVGQLISLKKNPTSPLAKDYKLGGVDFVQVGSGPQALTALKSGQVDLIDLTPEAYPAAKADPNIGLAIGTRSLDYSQIQLRLNAAPFDNEKVRAALEFAVDRKALNRVVYGGTGQVADQLFPKWASGYDKSIAGVYNYNPTKSKKMLTAAGFPKGVDFTMVTLGGQPTFERMAPLLQSQMEKAGFHVKLQRIQPSAILQEFYLSKTANAIVTSNLTKGGQWNNSLNNYTPIGFIANALGSPAADTVGPLVAQADAGSFDPKVIGPPMRQLSKLVMSTGLEVPLVFPAKILGYNKSRVGGKFQPPAGDCRRADLQGVYIKK